jgi:hypothetical protein
VSYRTPNSIPQRRLTNQDLITYTVQQVTPTLRLREAVVGGGGKCGSVALDRSFLKLLEARLGNIFRQWGPRKTDHGSMLMKAFDAAKKGFGTTTRTEAWQIPLGYIEDDPENGIEDGEMRLTMYHPSTPLIFYLAETYPPAGK